MQCTVVILSARTGDVFTKKTHAYITRVTRTETQDGLNLEHHGRYHTSAERCSVFCCRRRYGNVFCCVELKTKSFEDEQYGLGEWNIRHCQILSPLPPFCFSPLLALSTYHFSEYITCTGWMNQISFQLITFYINCINHIYPMFRLFRYKVCHFYFYVHIIFLRWYKNKKCTV